LGKQRNATPKKARQTSCSISRLYEPKLEDVRMDIEDHLSAAFITIYYRQLDAIDYQKIRPDGRIFSFETRRSAKGLPSWIN
jgi:hypothetical protein